MHPVLVDVVGSLIAGLSMLWAILAIFMGQASLDRPSSLRAQQPQQQHARLSLQWPAARSISDAQALPAMHVS